MRILREAENVNWFLRAISFDDVMRGLADKVSQQRVDSVAKQ